jgi:diguanylate cyclase (GGDEF)-like protein
MKNVVIVSSDIVLTSTAEKYLKDIYRVLVFGSIQSAMDYIYNSPPPDLVIVEVDHSDPVSVERLSELKEDPYFSNLPVLAVFGEGADSLPLNDLRIEDYLWRKDMHRDIQRRVTLNIARSERIVEINPLTRLPGNISINRAIQERLDRKELFALAYADLDQFKPLNDRYGFSRGDEIIKITARLLRSIVTGKQRQRSFVGHIGGDDFVFIMNTDLVEAASQELIDVFDRLIPTFYDPQDQERGYITSVDRQGNERTFKFVGISIGITDTSTGLFEHFGEMTERASEMKKYAKQFPGSCFRSDRRKPATDEEKGPGTGV